MKIAVNRRHFLGLLDRVASAAASGRVTHEVLKFVRVDADKRITVQATDGEVSIMVDGDAEVIEAGSALIDPAKTASLLKESSAEIITIEATDQAVKFHAGKSKFSLPSLDPATFPVCKRPADAKWTTTQADRLTAAINRTKFACDIDSTRYQLGGVLIEMGDMELFLVATDGRRLSKITIDSVGDEIGRSAIVPQKGLAAIVKAISGASDVNVHISHSSIYVATEAAYVESRLVEGRFPNHSQVIPSTEASTKVPIEAGPFVSAMRQALVVATSENRGVDLLFAPGELSVSAKGADIGAVETSMAIDCALNLKTTMDGRYVLDFAERCGSDEVFELNIESDSRPAVFVSNRWTYVVMPMARS